MGSEFQSNQFAIPKLFDSVDFWNRAAPEADCWQAGKYMTTNSPQMGPRISAGQDKFSAIFFRLIGCCPWRGGLQLLGGKLAAASRHDLNFPYDIPVHARFFSINESIFFRPWSTIFALAW